MRAQLETEKVEANQKSLNGAQQIKLAQKAFDALEFLNNKTWTHYRDTLLKMCVIEEKDHRGFMPDFNASHTADTASVQDAARLFAVKRVAEYILPNAKFPTGKDYLHTQTSCFYAAGLADEYGSEILKTWQEAGLDHFEIADLDYTQVVKVKKDLA